MDISIVLPCRNEEEALPACIHLIKKTLKQTNYSYEIIVSDSSTDKSPEIALREKCILVKHDKVGYGYAYLEGVEHAKGKYLFLADADMTYDFSEIPRFILELEKGAQFVIGDRFGKPMQKDAMPFLHKYLGNPVLSKIFNIFFNSKIKDVHCGMRAIRKSDFDNLHLHTTGMEFASEMIVKAVKNKYSFTQIPISYKRRIGESKLNTWRDGWRHLRFMLIFAPLFLFIIPGITLGIITSLLFYLNYTGNLILFGAQLHYHPLFIWSAGIIISFQLIYFGLFAKIYTYNLDEGDHDTRFMNIFFRIFNLEKGFAFAGLLFVITAILILPEVINWLLLGKPSLNKVNEFILGSTIFVLAVQTIFSSFIFSLLGVKRR